MYDRIRLFLPRTRDTPMNISRLRMVKEITDCTTSERTRCYKYGDLSITETIRGISINGSLAKALYGNNIETLNRRDTKRAIESIQDVLHTDLTDAQVMGFEFGTNFIMEKPVNLYLSKLGELPRFEKVMNRKTTLYYQQKDKALCFYDKAKEVTDKNGELPQIFSDTNILRYEIRFLRRVSRQLRQSINANTLWDDDFYRKQVSLLGDYFFQIKKSQLIPSTIMEQIKDVKDAKNLLLARLISSGDVNIIQQFVEELKAAKVYKDHKYYTRLKNELNNIIQHNSTQSDDDIIELENAVRVITLNN